MKTKLTIISVITIGFVLSFLWYGYTGIHGQNQVPQHETTIYDRQKNILTKLSPVYEKDSSTLIQGSSIKLIKNTLGNKMIVESLGQDANRVQKSAINMLLHIPIIQKKLYSKYYSQAYFGYGVFGLHTASKTFYGKEEKELTTEQLLWLFLAEEQYTNSGHIQIPILHSNFKKIASRLKINTKAPTFELVNQQEHPFYDIVTALYAEIPKLPIQEKELYLQPMDIYTTIDAHTQVKVEQTIHHYPFQTYKTDDAPDVQSAIVMMNYKSGEIIAISGGINPHYFDINRGMQLEKPPASAFKPISVYAPALEMGYTAQSILPDQPFNFNGYQPQNYDLAYRRTVTLKDAVAHSYNVPAVWLLNDIGLAKGKEFASKFGFKIDERDDLRMALGSLVNGVNPMQMAQAYGVFANDGVMNKVHLIQKIKIDKQQNSFKEQPKRIISSETTKEMNEILATVVNEGTASQLELPISTVGKTGTMGNSLQSNQSEHLWFVGTTLDLTSAVWIGFDETPLEGGLTVSSGDGAVKLYEAVLKSVYR